MRHAFFLILLFFAPLVGAQELVIFGFDASRGSETVIFNDGSYAQVATGNESALIIRFNSCGDTTWSKEIFRSLPLNRVFRAQADGSNLWLAAGLGQNQDSAVALLKMDELGQILLSKSIRAPINFVWYQMHLDVDGNLYLSGNSTATTGLANTVLKLNQQGQEIHAFQYSNNFIWGMSVPGLNGGLLNISGQAIYKLDANGNVEWIQRYQGYYQSSIPPIALNDGYLIFGKYFGAIDRTLVFKIDLQGNLIWSSDVYLNINATAASVASNGHIHMLFTNFGPNQIQWGVLELNADGSYQSTYLLPKNTGDQLYARDLDFLSEDQMLISGLIDFTFASYQAQVFRKLPIDISTLQTCAGTLSGIPTEPSNVTMDSNPPNFGANRYNDFTIQNYSFPESRVLLSLNNFCQTVDPLSLDLGPDRQVCAHNQVYLVPNINATDYQILWSTGASADSVLVTTEGWYWCEISNACGAETVRDSVFISFFPKEALEASFSPERPLLGDSLILSVSENLNEITWTYGDTSVSGNPAQVESLSSMTEGIIATYIDTNGCLVSDTLYPRFEEAQLYMPNAFSPNGDGLNDVFGPHPDAVYHFEVEIFDRYGKRQASLNDQWWDGQGLNAGAYTYVLIYQIQAQGELRIKRGIVNLIR
jgi:gliding motility-associated-like protein